MDPKLFSFYINSIGSIFKKYGLNEHIYADDIQIYFTANSAAATEIAISRCLKSVSEYMNENKLKLNKEKTSVIAFHSPRKHFPLFDLKVTADDTCLRLSTDVKSLGITLDQHLGLNKQVHSILKSSYFHLRNISFVSWYLDMDTTKLVNSLVTSRLDYGNAIRYGLPAN